MAEHPNAVLMRNAFDSLASGDLDAFKEVLAEDAFIHDPGHGAVSGDYVGRERVAEFFAKLNELSGGTFRAELIDVLADDERAVLIQRTTARRDGKTLDTRDVLVCEIRGGKVVSAQIFPADQDLESAFWSKTDAPEQRRHRRHSELSDPQLARLSEVLRQLGATKAFSGSEALSAAVSAGVVNTIADIGTAIEDLEDAGVLREVTKNPPRWEAINSPS
jgi:uncharacterized protein